MMKRQIQLIQDDFTYFYPRPIVLEDVNAYEVIYKSKEDMSGNVMSVQVTRSDGEVIEDVGQVSGNTARYTLKNNMYSVEGNITIWVAISSEDGNYITQGTISAQVTSNGGEPSASGDDRIPALTQLIIDTQQLQNQYNEMIAQMGGRPVIVMNESDYMEQIAAGTYDPNGIYMVVTGE